MNKTLGSRILGDSWYATSIDGLCDSLDNTIGKQYPRWVQRLAKQSAIIRCLIFYRCGQSYDLLLTCQRLPATWLLSVLEAWFSRDKRLVLLEFTPAPIPQCGWRRNLYKIRDYLFHMTLQKSLRSGHILAEGERYYYKNKYCLTDSQLFYFPWPMRFQNDSMPAFDNRPRNSVVSSGRFYCDWDTLLKAADGMNWDLLIICAAHEYQHVAAKALLPNIRVLTRVSLEAHQEYLKNASVYVISLYEKCISSGQIRVQNAIRAGVPIVATRVLGLTGYLEDNETAVLVEPGDWQSMRQAINLLLDDPHTAQQLARRAWEFAEPRTFENYKRELRDKVHNLLD